MKREEEMKGKKSNIGQTLEDGDNDSMGIEKIDESWMTQANLLP